MNERLRRHRRLIAGSLMLLLVAGVGYVLRSGGSAHAQSVQAVARPHPVPPVVATASQRRARGVGPQVAASVSRRPPAAVRTTRPTTTRPGVPSPPPTPSGVALALKQATGLSPAQVTSRPVCPRAAAGHASCAAQALVLRSTGAPVRPRVVPSSGHATPAAGASANPPQPATPAYLQQGYDLTSLSQSGGANDTVAVVDAYDDPTAERDLGTYRATYGLPACTTANGCFQKVGQAGTSSLPTPNASWEQEIALDLDAVSAICPNCHILLVEANSSSFSDLQAAMATAAGLGAKQISASWGGVSNGVPAGFRTFTGVATVAATGDYGYVGAGQDQYPAALPGVTAAGGTSLAPAGAPSARGFGEAAWSWDGLTGGGSGCDLQFKRPSYQPAAGCAGRAYADVSADADPNTGLNVYDNGSWSMVGGTSLATPLIAAYYAVTGAAGASPSWAYGASGSLNDIVSGSTGNCAAGIVYICNAGPGYDGPTGVGSISGSAVTGAPGIGGPSIASGSGANTFTASVRSDGATIAAGIYPNGLDTNWWIQYWPSGGSVQQTPAADVGSGTSPVTVTGYPSHLASNTTYSYRLVASNSAGTIYGYTYSFTTTGVSATTPVAAFTSSPAASQPGSPVTFNATGSTDSGATITDYSWDFGDGSTQDAKSARTTSHPYAGPGNYRVTLIVTNNLGQSETTTQTVTVDAPPTASFTTSPTLRVPAGFDATGSSDSIGTIIDYSWDFGDGITQDAGSTPTTSHRYAARGGPYTVKLTVTNDAGQKATRTQTVTVDDPPTATLTPATAVTTPGSPVSFSATAASPDSGGSIAGYSWDFGDPASASNTATGASASHTYASPGSYTVNLTVTDDLGVRTTTTGGVTVDAPPTASFTGSSSQPRPGAGVSFDASASTDTVGKVINYGWDFGDGSPQVAQNVPTISHTYAARGSYTVKLTVTNDAGQTATSTQTVTVDDPPTATLTPAPAVTTPGSPVSFSATAASPDSGGSIASYRWDFGDPASASNTATGASASHTYTSPGTYTVALIVTDDLGVSIKKTAQVTVDAAPTASFTASSGQPRPGAGVSFDASASSDTVGTITAYHWDFGDPSSANNAATGPDPTSHTYAVRGSYTVTLTITNDAGQTATSTHTVTVDDPPTATLTPATAVTTPGSPVSFSATAASPDTGGSIASYSWDFGDPASAGNTATGASASHTYASPGTYTVNLTVIDDLGVRTTTTGRVTVNSVAIVTQPSPPAPVTSPPAPVTSPPAPVTSPPAAYTQPPPALVAKLSGPGRQRLARATAHGLRLTLSLNQLAGASFEITVRPAHTKRTVVLARMAQRLGAGIHTVTLKLSRAMAARLLATGSLVLTVHVKVSGAGGATLTRTAKITLTR